MHLGLEMPEEGVPDLAVAERTTEQQAGQRRVVTRLILEDLRQLQDERLHLRVTHLVQTLAGVLAHHRIGKAGVQQLDGLQRSGLLPLLQHRVHLLHVLVVAPVHREQEFGECPRLVHDVVAELPEELLVLVGERGQWIELDDKVQFLQEGGHRCLRTRLAALLVIERVRREDHQPAVRLVVDEDHRRLTVQHVLTGGADVVGLVVRPETHALLTVAQGVQV
mmetsp:Transcript_15726/g.47156  ORF Transcript_15726/g.47156 Transcript_15726/m.47156 type:complete len:222 (-) Transcript_15726:1909-2574(-)